MFTGAVDAGERLFMKQTRHIMSLRHFFEYFHSQLIMVESHVCLGINRSHLMLGWSDFVMFRPGKDSHLPEFIVEILHKFL